MTISDASAVKPPQTTIVLYTLQSGVVLHVYPLTLRLHEAIKKAGDTEYPYPDPAPYQESIPDSFIPDELTRAEDNPAYQALTQKIDNQRAQYWSNRVLEICVHPAGADRDTFLKEYAPALNRIKDALRGLPLWVQLLYAFLATDQEISDLLELTQSRLPVKGGEIVGSFAYFR